MDVPAVGSVSVVPDLLFVVSRIMRRVCLVACS